MSISRAITNAYSGLAATSFRANVTSSNIANAGTVGYVRREAALNEATSNGQGNGVNVSGISRSQDIQLTRLRRDADSASARADVRAQAFSSLNRELGAPGDDYGLFASYEGFESALRELSITPESTALQSSLLGAASSLTTQLNELSQGGRILRENADAEISRSVAIVNSALHGIKTINDKIFSIQSSAGDTAPLEDERQRLLDTISHYIPIKDLPREGGHIEIITDSGAYLLNGDVQELEFTPSPSIPFDASYQNNIGSLSGLRVGDQELTPNSGTHAISAGAITGYFATRDTIIPEFLGRLDGMAADLIERFSDPNLDPSLAAGEPGLFTDAGAALDIINLPGLASRLSINAAVDPAQGGVRTRLRDGIGAISPSAVGNAEILNNMLDAFTAPKEAVNVDGIVGNFSASELAAGMTSLVGEAHVRADAIATSATSRSTILFDAEVAKSGVDTDHEMQSLLLIEQAYAANARVIQTVGSMMDTLLQI